MSGKRRTGIEEKVEEREGREGREALCVGEGALLSATTKKAKKYMYGRCDASLFSLC